MKLDVKQVADALLDRVERWIAPMWAAVGERLGQLETQLAAVPAGPTGPPGERGAQGEPGPIGPAGISPALADIWPMVERQVDVKLQAMPHSQDGAPGRDGRDGQSVDLAALDASIVARVATLADEVAEALRE